MPRVHTIAALADTFLFSIAPAYVPSAQNPTAAPAETALAPAFVSPAAIPLKASGASAGLGLFAAIPAVVIYNMLARSTAQYRALLSDAVAQVMKFVSRDLDRRKLPLSRAAE